jgi:hypothetical protein
MNKGVEILLSRMDSNPEEFDYDGWLANWSRLYDRYAECLTEEERAAVDNKRTEILRDTFTNSVMAKLLGAEREMKEISPEMQKYIDNMHEWNNVLKDRGEK